MRCSASRCDSSRIYKWLEMFRSMARNRLFLWDIQSQYAPSNGSTNVKHFKFIPAKTGATENLQDITNRIYLFVLTICLVWTPIQNKFTKNGKEIVRYTKMSRTEMVKYKFAN